MVAPPRREAIKLCVIFGRIAIDISLKIAKTYMHDNVDTLKFGEALEEIERQCPKIVRVKQG